MITAAHIRNFRCLVDVRIAFEPFTVLVGPNASGKSAVLAALDHGQPLEGANAWRGQGRAEIELFRGADRVARDAFRLQFLQLDLYQMRNANVVQEARALAGNGAYLTNVFATLTRSQQSELVGKFVELVPMYRDVAATPSSPGNHRLRFQDRWAPGLWYEPGQVSDGTMFVFAFLLLQYQQDPVDVVAIEEPERGLHPYLVGEVVGMLRNLATGKLGPRPIQVILATHSAELLEFADPKEVRFLSRRAEDGATHIESAPTESADWASAVKEYQGSLGGLWLSGSLGGVPGG